MERDLTQGKIGKSILLFSISKFSLFIITLFKLFFFIFNSFFGFVFISGNIIPPFLT